MVRMLIKNDKGFNLNLNITKVWVILVKHDFRILKANINSFRLIQLQN